MIIIVMASESLTEYEKKRLENIRRNAEMMASLKLQSKALELSSSLSTKRRQRLEIGKSYKTPAEKKPKSETPIVIRRSLRTQGVPPDAATAKGVDEDLVPSPVKKTPNFTPRNLDNFTMQNAFDGSPSGKQKHLIDTIIDMADNAPLRRLVKRRERRDEGLDLGSMELKEENVARIIPGRILSVKFFPSVDRRVVVAGNKFGNVAFWDVDNCEQDQDNGAGIYLYSPHTAPVSGFAIQPFALSKVYSSCYDGFVRLMDVNKESFELVYSSDHSIYALAQKPNDVKSLYFGEGRGLLNVWDTRVGKSSNSWMLHTLRINTVDFNAENSNLMATSSTDGTARIWDLRCIDEGGSKYLKEVDHGRAVHSAHFSPSGSCLATTSMNDEVGILSGDDFGHTSMVYHYNQTGRWISTFRAIWGWDDSHIFIGNMNRGLDVITTNDKKTDTLQSSHMTAIMCRFDAHPYKVGTLAGATAGGQIYVWTSR